MENALNRVNLALSEAFVGLHVTDATLAEINRQLGRKKAESSFVDFYNKQLRRVFNDGSITLGGRFYGGWWQAIPRRFRRHIYIGHTGVDRPRYCAEVDFSAHQPRIVYSWSNREPPGDPYLIYGENDAKSKLTRQLVKKSFLIMLNAASRNDALSAIRQQVRADYDEGWSELHPAEKRPYMTIPDMLPKGCPPLSEVMDDIQKHHAGIADHFYSDAGKRLMYVDSKIAEKVMLRLLDESDVVTLPIHDSFLVYRKFKPELERVMQEEAEAETGQRCPVKVEKLEFEEQFQKSPISGRTGFLVPKLSKVSEEEGTVFHTLQRDWLYSHSRRTTTR